MVIGKWLTSYYMPFHTYRVEPMWDLYQNPCPYILCYETPWSYLIVILSFKLRLSSQVAFTASLVLDCHKSVRLVSI